MIVINCEQGSDEWLQARCGVLTGSEFVTYRSRSGELTEQQAEFVGAVKSGKSQAEAAAIAGYKKAPTAEAVVRAIAGLPVGDWSGDAKNAAFKKAIERIGGQLLDGGFENWGMRRGHELEPAARAEHEIQLGEVVHRCGFVKTDCGRFGASLDGMIGHHEGGAEYKCFASPEKLREILLTGDLTGVTDQIQGGIWVAELQWMDFCLFCPELAPCGNTLWHRRVYRDEVYIKALVADLERFDGLVQEYMAKLREVMAPAEVVEALALAKQPQAEAVA